MYTCRSRPPNIPYLNLLPLSYWTARPCVACLNARARVSSARCSSIYSSRVNDATTCLNTFSPFGDAASASACDMVTIALTSTGGSVCVPTLTFSPSAPAMFSSMTSHNGWATHIASYTPVKYGDLMWTRATGAVRTVPWILQYVWLLPVIWWDYINPLRTTALIHPGYCVLVPLYSATPAIPGHLTWLVAV